MGKKVREKRESGLNGVTKTTANSKRLRMTFCLESHSSLELPNKEINLETRPRDDLLNIAPGIDPKDPTSARVVSEIKEEVAMVAKEKWFFFHTPPTNRSLARGLTENRFQEIEVDDPQTPNVPRAPKTRPFTNLVPIRVAPLSFETDDEEGFLRCTN